MAEAPFGQAQIAARDRCSGGSAVAMLRRATRVAHCKLERGLGLMAAGLSLAEYGTLLVRFAAVHQTLDDEICSQFRRLVPQEIFDEGGIDARRRMPALACDLDRLGLSLPRPVTFPLTSMAEAFGALYVTEGATLGGRVIAAHVRAVLGGDIPVAFFELSGVDVLSRWTSSRAMINRRLVTVSDRAEAARVAVAAFDQFTGVLGR